MNDDSERDVSAVYILMKLNKEVAWHKLVRVFILEINNIFYVFKLDLTFVNTFRV